MKHLFILFAFFFCFENAYSQNITGIILNAQSGEPEPRVSINVLNTQQGTLSGEDGSFSLTIDEFPVSLRISAIGFGSKTLHFEAPASGLVIYLAPRTERLSEVVLRSTIIPAELRRTPAAVSVLSTEDLDRYDETNVLQAISTVSGVHVNQGALNTNKLSIRGIGARSQYSTNRVKAFFEEIPISTAEGETTLDDIDQSVIGRAEIIKGPTSSVYGAGLGGVINLYARTPEEQGLRVTDKLTSGSFGLLKNTLKASYASGSTHLMAAYNHLESDGFRENGEYDRDSFTLHGKLTANQVSSLSVLAQFTRLKAYIPSSVNREQLEEDPSSAAFTWKAARGFESYDKGIMGLSYRHEFSDEFYNTTSVFMNFRDGFEPRPFDVLKEEQVAAGSRTKFNFAHDLAGMPSEVSFGAEIYREWYDIALFENLYQEHPGEGSVTGDIEANNSQDRRYYNVFAQWNLSFSEAWKLEAGLNLNSTKYELTDLFSRDDVDQSGGYSFETVLSPRLGMVYDFATNKSLYASVSHGFSTPTVAETLTPEGLINTRLRPETGINYETGFKGNWLNNRLYSEIAVFSIQINDLLVAERVAEDQYVGRNIGRTDHNGIELLLNYRADLSPSLSAKAFLNGSFNFYKFDEFTDRGTDFSGNKLPGVPERAINAGFDLQYRNRFTFHTTFQHVGEMPLNDANTGYNEAYDLFHVKTAYALFTGSKWEAEVFGGINNVFDEKYAAAIVPNAVGFGGASPRYFYPGNPRNYYAGLSLGYRF